MQIKLKRKYRTYTGDTVENGKPTRPKTQYSIPRSGNGNGRRGDARARAAVPLRYDHAPDTTVMVVDGLTGRRTLVK